MIGGKVLTEFIIVSVMITFIRITSNVMAFIENHHDTDRFLGNGKDTLALKQALSILLTVNRTPQLYYGTEVLMNGTKEKTDGKCRRKRFPWRFCRRFS